MVKLIVTDSYYNVFSVLSEELEKSKRPKAVFCEEKVSLMVERMITRYFGGSFDTDVYSFGKFLRAKGKSANLLGKEGSAMAVRRVLSETQLNRLSGGKADLSAVMAELIAQLMSANVTPADLMEASLGADGVLKEKLTDIANVFEGYEKFKSERGFDDQNSVLSRLPELIRSDEAIKGADVFLAGFTSWTRQTAAAVQSLIENAASVTAVLTEGENSMAFVNETADLFRDICRRTGNTIREKKVFSDYTEEGAAIINGLFEPQKGKEKKYSKRIFALAASDPQDEAERIAAAIKSAVMNEEARYRDITVALPDAGNAGETVKEAFQRYGIPFFLDETHKVDGHPLVTLVTAYADAYRKNLQSEPLAAFYKNPYFEKDKSLTDAFENHLHKFGINYGRIREPFAEDTAEDLEEFRKRVVNLFGRFDVRALLESVRAEERAKEISEELSSLGETEAAAVNDQIYEAVTGILDEMDMLLGGKELTPAEFKSVFSSGVAALELSIIPQYNDAVFIGGYKETALAKCKYLFAAGLTSDVPAIKEDVALLSDADIDALSELKLMVEPKIRVVNHREREALTLALAAFSERAYFSYPVSGVDGKKNLRGEPMTFIDKNFLCGEFPKPDGYLTFDAGLFTFAEACGKFAAGEGSFDEASAFYKAAGGEKLDDVLNRANTEVKTKLDIGGRSYLDEVVSPTAIEDFCKCPYRAFLVHGLKLRPREEGTVDRLSVGKIVHAVMKDFALGMGKIKDGEAEELFGRVKDNVLKRPEYAKFLSDPSNAATVARVMDECRGYCKRTYDAYLKGDFKVKYAEKAFGTGREGDLPPVGLLGGKVKLKGKIDRVDEYKDYYRIIDYKTGDDDVSKKSLFAGIKLQLFLYAAAIGGTLAGAYYFPVSGGYRKAEEDISPLADGYTLDDEETINAQDNQFKSSGKSDFFPASNGKLSKAVSAETMQSYLDYALAVSDVAAKNICDGVIVPSPYEKQCDKCEFSAMCGAESPAPRSLGKVEDSAIIGAVGGTVCPK